MTVPTGPHTSLRRLVILVAALAALALAVPSANAFMTWNAPGNAEHERITRLALACNSGAQIPTPGVEFSDLCLESLPPCQFPVENSDGNCPAFWWSKERTLRMLAGADGYFGGVGAPDRFYEAMISSYDAAHCDNGDYWFGGASYPFGADHRNKGLTDCLTLFQEYIALAVERAGRLVDGSGRLNASQTDISEDCNVEYDPRRNPGATHDRGKAKCDLLIAYGRAMHIAEDFFSHSNWVDANPATVDLTNPPGLGSAIESVPDVLRYPRTADQIAAFLMNTQVISGGYPKPTFGSVTRFYHDYALTKDQGDGYINWQTGSIPKGKTGKTGRGAKGEINGQDNFQKAVRGAAYAVRTIWTDFHGQITATYPGDRGDRIWNAIRSSTPWTQCPVVGDARRAQSPPTGGTSAQRTVRVNIVNRTGVDATCQQYELAFGEWGSMPADTIAANDGSTSFITLSNGTDTEGRANYNLFRLWWNNPLIGTNKYSCTPADGYTCSIEGGTGNDARITVTVTRKAGRAAKPFARVDADGATGERDAPAAPPSSEELNVEASKADYQDLTERENRLRPCSGDDARRVKLMVEDISCGQAIRLLSAASDEYADYCPAGWTMLTAHEFDRSRDPYWRSQEDEIDRLIPEDAIVCHDDTAGTSEDSQSRSLRYVLPHGGGGDDH